MAGEGWRAAAGGDRKHPVDAARPVRGARPPFATVRGHLVVSSGGLMFAILTFEDLDEDERGRGVEERGRGLSGESDSCMSRVASESGDVALPTAVAAVDKKPMAVDPTGTGCGLPWLSPSTSMGFSGTFWGIFLFDFMSIMNE